MLQNILQSSLLFQRNNVQLSVILFLVCHHHLNNLPRLHRRNLNPSPSYPSILRDTRLSFASEPSSGVIRRCHPPSSGAVIRRHPTTSGGGSPFPRASSSPSRPPRASPNVGQSGAPPRFVLVSRPQSGHLRASHSAAQPSAGRGRRRRRRRSTCRPESPPDDETDAATG